MGRDYDGSQPNKTLLRDYPPPSSSQQGLSKPAEVAVRGRLGAFFLKGGASKNHPRTCK